MEHYLYGPLEKCTVNKFFSESGEEARKILKTIETYPSNIPVEFRDIWDFRTLNGRSLDNSWYPENTVVGMSENELIEILDYALQFKCISYELILDYSEYRRFGGTFKSFRLSRTYRGLENKISAGFIAAHYKVNN